jgi:hypothetical protein
MLSFLISMPGTYLIRLVGLAVAPHPVRAIVEVVLTAASAWLAASASTAAIIRIFRLPIAHAWRRMALIGATPLIPCAFFHFRYQQVADSTGALWSQALGLLLAILIGLQTGYLEMTGDPSSDTDFPTP